MADGSGQQSARKRRSPDDAVEHSSVASTPKTVIETEIFDGGSSAIIDSRL